jgi:hypothetical protein
METNRRNKMKKNDLKKMLKPLIKECVQEMILEEG